MNNTIKLRVYTDAMLDGKSISQLNSLLNSVKTNELLTNKEQSMNIDILNARINGYATLRDAIILSDIEAGKADISDIGGN